jgi:hypothetical protein
VSGFSARLDPAAGGDSGCLAFRRFGFKVAKLSYYHADCVVVIGLEITISSAHASDENCCHHLRREPPDDSRDKGAPDAGGLDRSAA